MSLALISPDVAGRRCPVPPAVTADPSLRPRLIGLRSSLRGARVAQRIDSARLCAAVGCGAFHERSGVAASLTQVLTDAWGRAPSIYQPKAKPVSFDEMWMLRLCDAHRAGDAATTVFLLGSRLPRHLHRIVLSLLTAAKF